MHIYPGTCDKEGLLLNGYISTLESRCWVQWFSKWVPGSEHQHHLKISWKWKLYWIGTSQMNTGSRILCYKLSWCLCSMLKFSENHLLWHSTKLSQPRGELNSEDGIASCTLLNYTFQETKVLSRTNLTSHAAQTHFFTEEKWKVTPLEH